MFFYTAMVLTYDDYCNFQAFTSFSHRFLAVEYTDSIFNMNFASTYNESVINTYTHTLNMHTLAHKCTYTYTHAHTHASKIILYMHMPRLHT